MVELSRLASAAGRRLEVVVLSCDKTGEDMMAYQRYSMPETWMAVPFDHPSRNKMLSTFNIDSVPRALVFSAHGKLVCPNAAATPCDLRTLDSWAATAAREDHALK